jgi:hypothetical protein
MVHTGKTGSGTAFREYSLRSAVEQIVVRDWISILDSGAYSQRNGGTTNFHFLQRHFPELVNRVPIQYLANFTHIPKNKLKKLLESSLKDQAI